MQIVLPDFKNQGRNHWGSGRSGLPKIWTDHPNFLMKSVMITVTQQTAVHETAYTIRILFCTMT